MRQYKRQSQPQNHMESYQPHMLICTCDTCGRTYTKVDPGLWKYKWKRGKNRSFCSYKCLQLYRYEFIEAECKKEVKASTVQEREAVHVRDMLCIERGECHTYEEWAEIYEVDVQRLWSMKNEMFMEIDDAILTMLRERGQKSCLNLTC